MKEVSLDINGMVNYSGQLDVLEACGYKMERKGNFVKSIVINGEKIKMPLINVINDLYKEEIKKNKGDFYSEIEIAEYLLNKNEIENVKRTKAQEEARKGIENFYNTITITEVHMKDIVAANNRKLNSDAIKAAYEKAARQYGLKIGNSEPNKKEEKKLIDIGAIECQESKC